ncbi:hypothetical protein A9978_18780 [Pseudomonas sp. UMC65]|nr:hypothetical protein [Pseudomonas sp. UMC65]
MISVPRELLERVCAVRNTANTWMVSADANRELRALLAKPADTVLGFKVVEDPSMAPDTMRIVQPATQHQAERFTYSSKQATNCAGCGLRKHTPLRVDDMGGYVCLTCIDNKLNELLATEQHQGEPVAQVEVLGGGGQLWLALKTQWLPVGLHNLYTRPAEQPAQKYDDTLLPFMELMRRELHANSHKGDRPEWLKMTASTALEEIAHHFNKLDEAVGARDNPQIREYAADIANICMMLLDICGELAFVRQPEPVSSTSDKYKAELYDEVWQLARDMGFGNVTDALMKLEKQPATPVFAQTVLAKLERFQECALDDQDSDIGRDWFDVLVQLGLLNRVQRSPALWEITDEGIAVLEDHAEQPAPVAVVLPGRRIIRAENPAARISHSQGWNACLDEVARLNPPQQ